MVTRVFPLVEFVDSFGEIIIKEKSVSSISSKSKLAEVLERQPLLCRISLWIYSRVPGSVIQEDLANVIKKLLSKT